MKSIISCKKISCLLYVGLFCLLISNQASSQNYNIIQISDGNSYCQCPRINNKRQLVYQGGDNESVKIYFANNDNTVKFISNGDFPDINENGQIVWRSGDQITLSSNGVTSSISRGTYPKINNHGAIAFIDYSLIKLWSNGDIIDIPGSENAENHFIDINDNCEIVWGSIYNKVYLFSHGITTQVSKNGYESWGPSINNMGQIVYMGYDGKYSQIFLYDNGTTTQITNTNYSNFRPDINDKGQIVWAGRDNNGKDQIFIFSNGVTTKIADTDNYFGWASINNNGEIVWYGGASDLPQIYLATQGQIEVANQLYALCIGVRQNDGFLNDFRGDNAANNVATRFANHIPQQNIKTKAKDIADGGIKKSDIQKWIQEFNMKPGDGVYIYLTAHGGLTKDGENYYLVIGPDTSSQSSDGLLMDYDLYDFLKDDGKNSMDSISKWVIIDACHSGGFSDELGKLKKIALLSSVKRNNNAVWIAYNYGIFTHGLESAFSFRGFTDYKPFTLVGDENQDGTLTFEELVKYLAVWVGVDPYINNTVYEMGFGDPVIFTSDMWTPTGSKTADLADFKTPYRPKNIVPIINLLLNN